METNLTDVGPLADLEPQVRDGRTLGTEDAARVAACRDLPSVGLLGELARSSRHGNRVTYVRVLELPLSAGLTPDGSSSGELAEAGEVRVVGSPQSLEEATAGVRDAVAVAGDAPVTGFTLADLWTLAGADLAAFRDLAQALRSAGLVSVADVPLDRLSAGDAVKAIRVLTETGIGAFRATIVEASFDDRLQLIQAASFIQRETGAFKALSPLPQVDPPDQPSTGYDDVRTIALARLISDIPTIQVDWKLYGPKLAQVAIAYGADDLDNVAVRSQPELGHRRSPREEIERHIRMAFAEPAARNGRFDVRS